MQRCLVQVTFRPTLSDSQIRDEAARLLCQSLRQQELEMMRTESGVADEQEVWGSTIIRCGQSLADTIWSDL